MDLAIIYSPPLQYIFDDSDIYYLEEQEVKTNEVALPVSWARGSEMQTVPSIPAVLYFLHTL